MASKAEYGHVRLLARGKGSSEGTEKSEASAKTVRRRRPDDLTPREQEVLELIYAGLTNRALSLSLQISPNTGESHRANIMKKLRVSNISQLFKRAIARRLLPHPGRPPAKE